MMECIPTRKNVIIRAIAFCCAVAFILASMPLFCIPAFATDMTENRSARVGFFPFEGYYAVDASGERSGYGYELLQLIAQHANLSYTYVDNVATWDEMEQMLLDGRLDMLTSVQKTPEREEKFAFSETPISTSSTMMTVKSGNTRVVAGDYSTYGGIRVGVIRDNSHARKYADFARKMGFSYSEVPYDSLTDLEAALQEGADIDACVTSSLRPLHNEWIIEQFDPSPFYMMTRKDDTALIDAVNSALRQLTLYSPNWQTDLYSKYYAPDNGSNLLLSTDERSYIAAQAGRVFKAATQPDNAPFSWFEDGKARGIIPEIFAEIARRAGIAYEVVETKDKAAYQALVDSGQVDFVMDTGWCYSLAENNGYKLTVPYLSLTISQVSRIGAASSDDSRIAVPDGPVLGKLSGSSHYGDWNFASVDTEADAVNGVVLGDYERAAVYTAFAQQYIQNNIHSDLQMSLMPDAQVDLSVGVPAVQNYLLLSVLSKSAESVKMTYSQDVLLKSTLNTQEDISFRDYFHLHPLQAAAALAIVLTIAAIFVILLFNGRRQRRANIAIQKAKHEADAANEAKSTFLSSMSHDLRTPLNGIVGFTDLAIREDSEEKRLDYLKKIQVSGNLLSDLVEDTLELSRIESGKMTLNLEPIKGGELARTVAMAVTPAAELKHIHLIADSSRYPREVIYCDRLKLQKVMLNLLSNAIKYTPRGGTVSMLIEVIEPPRNGMTRRLVVEDNGIGMSEEFLTKLYEPFSQEHRAEAGNVAGTGLGLTIVKRIVDLMNGTITVESRVNKGTKFIVDLPVSRIEEDGDDSASSVQVVALKGKNILLCEDNDLNAEIAALLLKEQGVEVTRAENGQAGVDLFAASPEGFFFSILMDLRMPVLDGYAAAKAIRKLKRSDAPDIPIIALSADAFEENKKMASEAGMTGYLTKPIDPAKLVMELSKK